MLGGYRMVADSPSMIMIHVGSLCIELSTADPLRKFGKIHFIINNKIEMKSENCTIVWNEMKGMSDISVTLPQTVDAEKCVTVKLSIN